uniref:Domain of unknown function with conserved HDNR motif domain-containing protein n=1 Tax=Castor canadensis TaxID=51338 RepID=A0A8C0XD14_CASCN
MAKGRRFNPTLDKDGRWFPHIGLTQRTPESITSTALKESHCPRLSGQVEGKLPPIYKVQEKQAVNHSFPFSVHDNRHSFEDCGYYLDSVSTACKDFAPILRVLSSFWQLFPVMCPEKPFNSMQTHLSILALISWAIGVLFRQ